MLRISGKKADEIFKNEAGGHRFQRVSPTDKRGRVHSSTITIAVLPEATQIQIKLNHDDLEISTCKSGGNGGQHVQKTETAVQIKHIPTGIQVRCESRSQHQNKEDALALIRTKLMSMERAKVSAERSQSRKDMVGGGARGDKRRTVRQQDGIVTDHILNKKISWKDYSKGIWNDLLD